MQRSFRKATWAGTALLAGAIAVLVFVVAVFRQDQAEYRTMADHSDSIHEIIDLAQGELSALKDSETGQRGYLLTGKASYLDPYSTGIHDFRQLLSVLEERTAQDRAASVLIHQISVAGGRKLDELAATISLYNEGRGEAALERVRTDVGKTYMDQVRAATGELVRMEEAAFARNNRATADLFQRTRNRFFLAAGILFALMLLGTLLLSVQLRNERQLVATVESSEAKYRELSENLEGQVSERTVHLQNVNAALNSFSYSVSHDLRAPLRSIDGFSLIVLEDYSDRLDDTGRDLLRRIRAAAMRMGVLIQSLLDLSRVTATEFARERVSLSAMAESVVDSLRAEAPEREVEVVITPGLETHADPQLTRVALDNLLSNAWKFTTKTRGARIEVGKKAIDGKETFFVRDNGAGFDPQFADRLFTPFQRLHSASEFDGSGVGLATVQRVIHRHEGKIWAESTVGEGTTFFFTL